MSRGCRFLLFLPHKYQVSLGAAVRTERKGSGTLLVRLYKDNVLILQSPGLRRL